MVQVGEKVLVGSIGGFNNYKQEFIVTKTSNIVHFVAYAGNSGTMVKIISVNGVNIDGMLDKIKVESLDGYCINVHIAGIKEQLILTEYGLFAHIDSENDNTFVIINGIRVDFCVCKFIG